MEEKDIITLLDKIESLEGKVDKLLRQAKETKLTWISEDEAAELLGITAKTLRRNVVYRPNPNDKRTLIYGTWNIDFRTNPTNKGYQYNRKSIERFMNGNRKAA